MCFFALNGLGSVNGLSLGEYVLFDSKVLREIVGKYPEGFKDHPKTRGVLVWVVNRGVSAVSLNFSQQLNWDP